MIDRKANGHLRAYSYITLCCYFAFTLAYNRVDIGESQTKAPHIMPLPGAYPIEAVKDTSKLLPLHADTIILNRNEDIVSIVLRTHPQSERSVGIAVLHSVIQEIKEDIGEMHLISSHPRIRCLQVQD